MYYQDSLQRFSRLISSELLLGLQAIFVEAFDFLKSKSKKLFAPLEILLKKYGIAIQLWSPNRIFIFFGTIETIEMFHEYLVKKTNSSDHQTL